MMKVFLGVASLVGLIVAGSYVYTLTTEDVVRTTINRTDRECKVSNNTTDCRYVVYTPEEVFENVDSWWYLKFNSTDYNNKLIPGKTYDLTVYGMRVPFLSWYRNVVDYQEVGS